MEISYISELLIGSDCGEDLLLGFVYLAYFELADILRIDLFVQSEQCRRQVNCRQLFAFKTYDRSLGKVLAPDIVSVAYLDYVLDRDQLVSHLHIRCLIWSCSAECILFDLGDYTVKYNLTSPSGQKVKTKKLTVHVVE